MPQTRHWVLLGLMSVSALLDQGSKWLAKTQLNPFQPWPVIPHVFQLTLSYNTGAAFSMFNKQPHLLKGFTLLLFLGLLWYGWRKTVLNRWETIAMGLILGGALGNLLDRVLQGRVTDFLDVVAIHYPIFNLADSLIFIGVWWLIILYLRQPNRSGNASSPASVPPADASS